MALLLLLLRFGEFWMVQEVSPLLPEGPLCPAWSSS